MAETSGELKRLPDLHIDNSANTDAKLQEK